MEETNNQYSFREFLRVFKRGNWNTWWLLFMFIGSMLSFLSVLGIGIPKALSPYFLWTTIFSAPFFVFNKAYGTLFNLHNKLNLQLEKISSSEGPIAELVGGFKRKEFKWIFTVNEDESIVAEKTYIIQSFRELPGIMFQKVFYPNLEENKPQLDNDFIYSYRIETPHDEKIKIIPKVSCHGGSIFYSVKFNPILPEKSIVEIKTKPVTYPKGSLVPQPYYEEAIKEGGRAITYLSTVPTEKVRVEVVLPKNKNYLALTCLGSKFFGVASIDTDSFLLEKEGEIYRETGTPNNVFWFTINNPTLLYEYSLFWKIAND